MSETQAAPQLSGKLFLFERPELLNKDSHGALGVNRPERPFDFCANVRAAPITISEIPSAMKHYPVVFMSMEDPAPLAILGLVDDVNLFVDDAGNWEAGAYIPGYVRRYPFALASETGGDRHAIVIDRAYAGVAEGGETPFFDAQGESTDATKQAIEFCKQYEKDRMLTAELIKRLKDADLIQPQSAQYTPQGETEPKTFANYYGVDEKRLNELSDEKFLELRKAGLLPIIHAQLFSLTNWRSLMQRRAERFNLTEAQIFEKGPVN